MIIPLLPLFHCLGWPLIMLFISTATFFVFFFECCCCKKKPKKLMDVSRGVVDPHDPTYATLNKLEASKVFPLKKTDKTIDVEESREPRRRDDDKMMKMRPTPQLVPTKHRRQRHQDFGRQRAGERIKRLSKKEPSPPKRMGRRPESPQKRKESPKKQKVLAEDYAALENLNLDEDEPDRMMPTPKKNQQASDDKGAFAENVDVYNTLADLDAANIFEKTQK